MQRLEEKPDGLARGSKRPCHYFDLVGGTSTDGLIAIMLSRLQMDIPTCIEKYRSLSAQVFYRYDAMPFVMPALTAASAIVGVSWFSGDRLKAAI